MVSRKKLIRLMLVIGMIFASANVQASLKCWVYPSSWWRWLSPEVKTTLTVGAGVSLFASPVALLWCITDGRKVWQKWWKNCDEELIEQAEEARDALNKHQYTITMLEDVLNKENVLKAGEDARIHDENQLSKIGAKIWSQWNSIKYLMKNNAWFEDADRSLHARVMQLRKKWWLKGKQKELLAQMKRVAQELGTLIRRARPALNFMNLHRTYFDLYKDVKATQRAYEPEFSVLAKNSKNGSIKEQIKHYILLEYSKVKNPFARAVKDLDKNINETQDLLDEYYPQLCKKAKAMIAKLRKIKEIIGYKLYKAKAV